MTIGKKEIVEIIGATGIIASLIFVGLQLKFDSRVAISDQFAFRAESGKADNRAQLESETYMALQEKTWQAGDRWPWWTDELENYVNARSLTGKEVWALYLASRLRFLQWDNIYFQYTQGMIEEAYWRNAKLVFIEEFQDPFVNAVFHNVGGPIQRVIVANEL